MNKIILTLLISILLNGIFIGYEINTYLTYSLKSVPFSTQDDYQAEYSKLLGRLDGK